MNSSKKLVNVRTTFIFLYEHVQQVSHVSAQLAWKGLNLEQEGNNEKVEWQPKASLKMA